MRSLRQTALIMAVTMTAALINPSSAHAVSAGADNHADTDDYCMRAYDVTLTTSELAAMDDDAVRSAVLTAADPRFLIRDNSVDSSQWIQVTDGYTANFSQMGTAATSTGYPVTISLPEIGAGLTSAVSFLAYVQDDTRAAPSPTPTEPPVDPVTPTDPPVDPVTPTDPPVDPTPPPSDPPVIIDPTPEPSQEPTPKPTPTPTPKPTQGPEPYYPPEVYIVPEPTVSPKPTASPKPTSTPTPTKEIVPVDDSTAVPPASSGGTAAKGGPTMTAYVLFAAAAMSAAYFTLSAASDLRVLHWYAQKKLRRQAL